MDLDYKSLSNAGTWFLGRLQTDRDRKRILDGLEGATMEGGGTFNRKQIEELLSNLDKRVFLLHNVHEDHPQVFYTRWAMSYLRGPLTRKQIKGLVKPSQKREQNVIAKKQTARVGLVKQKLPKEIKPLFLKRFIDQTEIDDFSYKPYITAIADIRFYDRTKKIDLEKTVGFTVPITNEVIAVNWDEAIEVVPNEKLFAKRASVKLNYDEIPAAGLANKNYTAWQKFFKEHLASDYYIEVFHSSALKQTSKPFESVRDFKIRLAQITREQRDEAVQNLKKKYARRAQTIQRRIQRAEERIEREKSQSSQQKLQTAIAIGSTILGALFGRKKVSVSSITKAGAAMKSAGRVMKESGDVSRAKENLVKLNLEMDDLHDRLQDDLDLLQDKFDLTLEQLETVKIRPKKTNISVKLFSFTWIPMAEMEMIEDVPGIEIIS
jgi:hypothetical protein